MNKKKDGLWFLSHDALAYGVPYLVMRLEDLYDYEYNGIKFSDIFRLKSYIENELKCNRVEKLSRDVYTTDYDGQRLWSLDLEFGKLKQACIKYGFTALLAEYK